MLIQCEECQLQVSDKAIVCPHCGNPLKPDPVKRITRSKNKRRRLPNGFGQISEIKDDNLRKPFRVMVTVGKTAEGKPIAKLLKPESYFETYNEAYAALVEYNRNPYDLNDDIKLYELYERWSTEYFVTLKNKSSIRSINSAWTYCSELYNYRVKDIRARHIKGVIENGTKELKGEIVTPGPCTQGRIKSMFNLMMDYAEEHELVDKNYARTFNISQNILDEKEEKKKPHILFTDEERQKLWDNVNKIPYTDMVIIQCYSGWRPQELGKIKLEDVDLENWTFTGGMKTDAGKDRIVPIHSKIKDLVKKRYDEAVELKSEYLFNCTDSFNGGLFFTYDKYKYRFIKIIEALRLNPEHRAHDPRKDFTTRLKRAGADEYAVKRLIGHEIDDTTEKYYTERDVEWLRKDIELLE